MVRAILDVPGIEQRDLSSVRVIIAGGEKMPIPFIERLRSDVPVGVVRRRVRPHRDGVGRHVPRPRRARVSKLGSVGRPCLYLELDIWDEHGASMPPGERGEVVLRGPKVFKGYWRDPDATSTAFAGGWFHTGDIGVRDDDGYVYIVDRLKDMIVSGGENIASSEVERVLYEHDAVVEVAVVGRPDERWGEVPVAFVVATVGTTTTPEELIEHCRGQLAKFKVPKDVVFVDELPRNPSGKVLKRELRDRRDRLLGAQPNRCVRNVGRPVHEVGRDVVAGLVVDRRPVLARRLRSSADACARSPAVMRDEDAREATAAGRVDLAAHRAVLVREERDHRCDELGRHRGVGRRVGVVELLGLVGGAARHARDRRGRDHVDLDAVRARLRS